MNRINRSTATRFLIAALTFGALAACANQDASRDESRTAENVGGCEASEARRVVVSFGERLKDVSLLAPDTLVSRQMMESYGEFVTPDLLSRWLADPAAAPGREVSSPWPDRIEVDAVEPDAGGCRVDGRVILVTSVEARQGGGIEEPVSIRLVDDDGWRIADYEARSSAGSEPVGSTTGTASASPASAESTPESSSEMDVGDPSEVIRQYYDAIDARDYRRAFALWGNEGASSGQSYDDFAAGFAETARVEVEIGEVGRVEGAAGSRFVEVPVAITAETTDGKTQRFDGSYTLRRAVVPGATPAQRRWHIYSAEIAATG